MLVPLEWLKALVPVTLLAEDLAERLTMAGFEVEAMQEVGGSPVFDIKVTANRGDALSMLGLAREVSALTGTPLCEPDITLTEGAGIVADFAQVIVEAPDLCPRYVARIISGITLGPSPEWAQRRLTQAGMRPINNVVDVTNYVMLEMGQPLHAFDLHRIAQQTIVVRRAKEGEVLTTLDSVPHELTPAMLVIADPEKAVALAGIMGGENSEVYATTHDILLESAHFDRTCIRKTARAQGVSTESSYRFERIVDPAGAAKAADRAAKLMVEWSGGTVAKGRIDVCVPLPKPRVIQLRPARVNAVLGTAIPPDTILAALRALGLDVTVGQTLLSVPPVNDGESVPVTIPSFRPDLLEEMDLIEEIARIYGYDRIPVTVPGNVTAPGRLTPEFAFEGRLRELLSAAGLFEGLSYSLIDARFLDQLRLPADAPERLELVPMRNPKSEEYTHLRPSMLVSMLETLRNNARRGIADVQVFEVGRTFRNIKGGLLYDYADRARRGATTVKVKGADKLPLERRALGLAVMGRPWTTRWGTTGETDYFWLKGIIEQVLTDLGITGVSFTPGEHPTLHPGRTAEIAVNGIKTGLIGEVHPQVATNLDLPTRAYLAELDVDVLMAHAADARPAPRLSRFPAVDRDIAFLIADSTPADRIEHTIIATAGPNLESVALFDVYQGSNVPAGQRSLAYRLVFRADDRTLDDEEVDAAVHDVRRVLADTLSATLR